MLCLPLGELDTNCYFIWDSRREALVVDPGDDAQTILAALHRDGLTVSAVVLTHAHFDHMLAAQEICDATGAPLWVGAGDEAALADKMKNLSAVFGGAETVALHADRLLREGDVLTAGGYALTVWETPGHTPGSICLIGTRVALTGDTLFAGSIGRVDFPGGDMTAMERSLQRLKDLPDELRIYPGHGPASTIGYEKNCNPYLR